MDKRRSLLNVGVSIFFRFVLLIGSILVKRFLIQYVGNEMNGLNALYLSIIGFLSVAELGVGSAISFGMYKPIVEGNHAKVAALYQLFTKSYVIIGSIIFFGGIVLMPALPYLAKDYASLNVSLYLTFFLMLLSVVLSYAYSSKTSLINAYMNDYVTTTITSCGGVLQYVMQILALVFARSFVWYLAVRIVSVLAQWIATECWARAKHKDILMFGKQRLDAETKRDVFKNVKAMFMHKIGSALVNSADSMIISAFIGVAILGKFSNYTTIATSMTTIIMLFFTPLTSVVGHMFVSEKEQAKRYYNFFYGLNFVIGVVFFLGYYATIENLITLLFGDNLSLGEGVAMVVTMNFFVQFMRRSTLLFRDATGTFYNDRWKPLYEGLLNVVLSITFVVLFTHLWGEEFGVVGVILATIITDLSICHIIEPHVLYKYAFNVSPKYHYLKNYIYIAIFLASLLGLQACMRTVENEWLELLINGFISIAISFIVVLLTLLVDKDFRHYAKIILLRLKNKMTKRFQSQKTT